MENLQNSQNIQDPAIIGVQGLKGLNQSQQKAYQQYIDLRNQGYNIDLPFSMTGKSYDEYSYDRAMSTPTDIPIGFTGINDSRFDKNIHLLSQLNNLEDTRARLQSEFGKVVNGTIKGAAIAGTTFLESMLTAMLLPEAIKNGFSKNGKGFLQTIWDDDAMQGIQALNQYIEKVIPNYYTDDEKNNPWYKSIWSGNFFGDKLLKNLGFTVGAFYSGNVASAALRAVRLPQAIKFLTTSTRLAKLSIPATSSLFSSLVEGSIEAINNSNDWAELQRMQAEDRYNYTIANLEASGMGDSELAKKALDLYNSELAKIEEDRVKMGNSDLLANLGVLLPSNFFQFGRLYSGGYKSARRVWGIIKNANNTYGVSKSAITTRAALKGIGNALSEGAEELAQSIVATAAGEQYASDVLAHYKNQLDPEANEEAISYINALGKSIAETLGDVNSYEEFAIGALTGALGMPQFRSMKNSETGKRRSPIYFEGGIKEAFDLYKENTKKATELTEYMNKRIQDPKFVNYYRGLVNHIKEGKLMDAALENSNEFSYKSAEHRQLVNDIMVFDNAGRLEDLQSLINDAFDTSDESLQEIVNSSEISPFKDNKGNPMYSTPEGKQKMIEILTSKRDLLNNTIKEYIKNRDRIQLEMGDYLSDEALQELTFMKTMINNYENRLDSMTSEKSEFREELSNLINIYQETLDAISKEYKREDLSESDSEKIKVLKHNIETLNSILSSNARAFKNYVSRNKSIINFIKSITNNGLVDNNLRESLLNKLNDIQKLYKARETYDKSLNSYLQNPKKLENDIQSTINNAIQEEIIDKANTLADNIRRANTQQEVMDLLEAEDNELVRESVIEILKKENNEFIKDIDDLRKFYNIAQSIIDSKDDGSLEYEDTKSILSNFAESGITYDDLINRRFNDNDLANIIYQSNPNEPIEVIAARAVNASYVLDGIISKAKKDNKFKNLFDSYVKSNKPESEEKKPEEKTITEEKKPEEKDLFEDKAQDKKDSNSYIEDVKDKQIVSENSSIDREYPTTNDTPLKEYYLPAIPEFHIEKSKPSVKDYRPFKDVVRTDSINFDRIYDYLDSKGAFDYVNKGNLKVGQVIKFIIDPSYNETTPFMAVENPDGSLQIVGSLMEGETAIKRYRGLQELLNNIREEYNKNKEENKIYVSSYSTKVASIMNGTIMFSSEDTLNNLNGLSGIDTNPILAVVSSSATLTAGNRIESNLIEPIQNASTKIGRVYLLVKNARNTYSPVAVRITPFNSANYNIDDVNVQETPIYKELFKSIKSLLSAKNDVDLSKAVSRLKETLYLKGFHLNRYVNDSGVNFLITKVDLDNNGNEKYTYEDNKKVRIEQKEWIHYANDADLDTVAKDYLRALLKLGTNFQVNVNNAASINSLIKSNLVTSNIIDAQMRNSWFTTDYYTSENKKEEQTKPKPIVKNTENINSIGGKDNIINGTKVTLDESNYYVNTNDNKIYRSNGSEITARNEFTQLLLDIAWADNTFGNATESDIMKDNIIITPNGKVLDRNTNGYLDEESAEKFKNELNKSKETPKIKLSKFSKGNTSARLRKAKPIEYKQWNKEEELKWLEENLPQFSTEDRLKLINGLYKVAENGVEAWGALNNGIIYLSDIAAEGTLYHEAFHAVFNLLLNDKQRAELFEEAARKFGNLDYLTLEEEMADSFMMYKLNRDNQGLGHRILNFFKDLYFKVTNWLNVKPTLDNYFRMIDNGSFKNKVIQNSKNSFRLKEEVFTDEMQNILNTATRDSEGKLLAPNGKISNLTERQYAQVRTKAFKEWFGDWENNPSEASKVVDENGEPLVVYSGRPRSGVVDFSKTLKSNRSRTNYTEIIKKGIYFTENKNVAALYAGSKEYTNYLDLELVKYGAGEDGSAFNNKDLAMQVYKITSSHYDELYNRYNEVINDEGNPTGEFIPDVILHKGEVISAFLNIKNPFITDLKGKAIVHLSEKDRKEINKSNGVIIKNVNDSPLYYSDVIDDYIVFNANQIKSAVDNVGTFSTTNDDIRFRLPTIAELRKNAKTIREKEDVYIEERYREAQQKVNHLNSVKRFTSSLDAKSAFNALHIPNQYFSYIANTQYGYKIRLINREQLEKYKQDSFNDKYEQWEIMNEMNKNKKSEFVVEWDRLDPDYQMALANKGWTRETWNKYKEPIREQALRCISIK